MKWIIGIVGLVIIVPLAWYLLSPLLITIEADDASPLDAIPAEVVEQQATTAPGEIMDESALDHMTEETKEEFMEAMKVAMETIMVKSETMPVRARAVAQGNFRPSAHDVEGKAILIEQGEERILRFEDFDTVNGPDLHIYLSTDTTINDAIDLGSIKATRGNVNYNIDPSIDTDRYNNVLVWCEPFGVLFSYSELT